MLSRRWCGHMLLDGRAEVNRLIATAWMPMPAVRLIRYVLWQRDPRQESIVLASVAAFSRVPKRLGPSRLGKGFHRMLARDFNFCENHFGSCWFVILICVVPAFESRLLKRTSSMTRYASRHLLRLYGVVILLHIHTRMQGKVMIYMPITPGISSW